MLNPDSALPVLPEAPRSAAHPGAGAPVYVAGEVTAKLGAEELVWGQLNVLLERTRHDRGNLRYEIFRDAGDPGHFLVHQTWKTPQYLYRHLQSEAVARCIRAIAEAAQVPLALTVCDVQRAHTKPAPVGAPDRRRQQVRARTQS